MKSLFTTLLLIVLAITPYSLAAEKESDHICFRVLDTNGDGVVTIQEFVTHEGKNAETFNAADANQDGKLTHDEYHVSLGHGSL